MSNTSDTIRDRVREGYGQIAEETGSSCCGPSCCGGGEESESSPERLAQAVGYAAEELAALPEGANLGLSCGNPIALASLREGEVVVDLGSGGGFDIFIAGRKVGAAGRAIGVDMTAQMVSKARANIDAYRRAGGPDNVEFRLGEIEHLPLADESVDVVISNCVINLSPEKPQVWREIARVLKPGGRVAVSDLALKQPLPPAVGEMIEALVGCIAGAVLVDDTKRMVHEAGLTDLQLEQRDAVVDAMSDIKDPLYRKLKEALPAGAKPSNYVTSLALQARKA